MNFLRDTFDRALFYAASKKKDFTHKNRKLRLHPEFVQTNSPQAMLEHLNKSSGTKPTISSRDKAFIENHFSTEYERLGY